MLVAIDRIFLHERTGAAALGSLKAAGRTVADPSRVFCVMDHIVDTRPGRGDQTLMPGGQAFITETRAAAPGAAGSTGVSTQRKNIRFTCVAYQRANCQYLFCSEPMPIRDTC